MTLSVCFYLIIPARALLQTLERAVDVLSTKEPFLYTIKLEYRIDDQLYMAVCFWYLVRHD